MDTSETYIKMCDCEEIQEQRVRQAPWDSWIIGDYYYTQAPIESCISIHNDASSYGLGIGTIWLPRQDQLQEMLDKGTIWSNSLKFEYFLREEGSYNIKAYPYQFSTWEQLWLAFVMKEKHNKTWNGSDWIST